MMAMFSATMPPQVERIARTYLQRPLTIRIGDVVSMKNTRIKQTVRYLQESQKKAHRLCYSTPLVYAPALHGAVKATFPRSLQTRAQTVQQLKQRR